MDLEFKRVALELRADDAGVIEGYGSVFGGLDSYGDTIIPGAFQKSISAKRPKMLWQHRMDMPIGVWDEIAEDAKGLRLKGRLADTSYGQDARKLLRMGALDGLSIGFRAVGADRGEGGTRILKEIDLVEVSVVTDPADPAATVTGVKSEHELKQAVERTLIACGLSRKDAKTRVSQIWNDDGLRDAGEDDEALRDAVAIKTELQRILKGAST